MAQCLGQEFDIHERIKRIVEKTAEASGAVADVTIVPSVPVTYNDPALSERMAPTLQGVARNGNVVVTNPSTTAEDFSFFQQKIPGFYFNPGVTPDGTDPGFDPKIETVSQNLATRKNTKLPLGVPSNRIDRVFHNLCQLTFKDSAE